MVYITSWDDFVERSLQWFRAQPDKTRYVMKYRNCDGKLVLKVTDDKQCLKFKTDQAQDAKKMEKLNNIFFTLMARGPEADVTGKEQAEAQPAKKYVEGSNDTIEHIFWFYANFIQGFWRDSSKVSYFRSLLISVA